MKMENPQETKKMYIL